MNQRNQPQDDRRPQKKARRLPRTAILRHEDISTASLGDLLAALYASRVGQPMPPRGEPAFDIPAYINWGTWIVECPDCHAAVRASLKFPFFICYQPDCAQVGIWKNVIFPEDREDIEAELVKRTNQLGPMDFPNRNWLPSETIADIRQENDRHGVARSLIIPGF